MSIESNPLKLTRIHLNQTKEFHTRRTELISNLHDVSMEFQIAEKSHAMRNQPNKNKHGIYVKGDEIRNGGNY